MQYCRRGNAYASLLCVSLCAYTVISCENKNSDPLSSLFFGDADQTALSLGKHITYVRSEIVSDNNRDKRANPGETIYLLVTLKNSGTEQLLQVRLVFSTKDSRVTGLIPQQSVYLGTMDSGVESPVTYDQLSGFGAYSIQFKIASNAVRGSTIHFDTSAQDAGSSSWAMGFDVLVE
jgi:hypothetical protein